MIDLRLVPPVADDELLARCALNSSELRADGTVRPQLFLPYRRVELSVNRHRDASIAETWTIGRYVALQRGKELLGRADSRTETCRQISLEVKASPILPQNPNHADIVDYPPRKDEQLVLAAKLAASIEGSWIAAPTDAVDS